LLWARSSPRLSVLPFAGFLDRHPPFGAQISCPTNKKAVPLSTAFPCRAGCPFPASRLFSRLSHKTRCQVPPLMTKNAPISNSLAILFPNLSFLLSLCCFERFLSYIGFSPFPNCARFFGSTIGTSSTPDRRQDRPEGLGRGFPWSDFFFSKIPPLRFPVPDDAFQVFFDINFSNARSPCPRPTALVHP